MAEEGVAELVFYTKKGELRQKPFSKRLRFFFDVIKLERRVFRRRYYRFYPHMLSWLRGSKKFELFLCYSGKALAGYCLMKKKRIDRVAVSERFRRKGIAERLVPGYANTVKTPLKREDAIAFYKSLGFKEKKRQGQYLWMER